MLLHFEEVAVVDHRMNHILHVIRQIRLRRHDLVEGSVSSVSRIGASLARRVVQIIRRHKAQQLAHHRQALGIVVRQKVRHAGSFVVRHGATKLLFCYFLMRDGLDHVRPGNEHVGGLVDHQHEVGNRR